MEKRSYYHNPIERNERGDHHDDKKKGEGTPPGGTTIAQTNIKPPDPKDDQTIPSPTKKKHHVNPFGSAKPREEVLARKGIDFHIIDDRIQKKATVAHFTGIQEIHLKELQDDLTAAEQIWREANEKELPEEELRIIVDEKRRIFNDVMTRYKKENEERGIGDHMRFERPSERRRRRFDESHNDERRYHRGSYDDEDPYASFHRRDRLPHERHHNI
eukprot:63310_1